jgi:hypothetical protein
MLGSWSGGRKNWASQITALLGLLSLRGWFLGMPCASSSNELGVPDLKKNSAKISTHYRER